VADTSTVTKTKNQKSRFLHANEVVKNDSKLKTCVVCKDQHNIEKCDQFLNLELKKKWKIVRENKLCFNCLRAGPRSNACTFQNKCEKNDCDKKLNQLLHTIKNDAESSVGGAFARTDNTRQQI